MKKYLFPIGFFIAMISLFWACQEDDVCLDSKTPQLIIRFTQEGSSEMDSLYVYRQEEDGSFTTVQDGTATDSLAVALRLDDTTATKLVFASRENTADKTDTISVNYTYDTEYVSKSCGFKVIYSDISITQPTTNFITSYSILQNDITDETSAQLQLNY